MTELGLAFAACIGAPARYVTETLLARRYGTGWPFGTFAVNVVGSFILGLLIGLTLHHGLPHSTEVILGTGFCGTLTTYSAFSFEAVRLVQEGRPRASLAYVAASVGSGLLAAAAGLGLALL